jgi:preprotein translocase YajC subunit
MLRKLDKGSKVVTQGGLVGVIEKVISDNDVLVDFGNGVKMTVLRSSVVGRYEEQVPPASKK